MHLLVFCPRRSISPEKKRKHTKAHKSREKQGFKRIKANEKKLTNRCENRLSNSPKFKMLLVPKQLVLHRHNSYKVNLQVKAHENKTNSTYM